MLKIPASQISSRKKLLGTLGVGVLGEEKAGKLAQTKEFQEIFSQVFAGGRQKLSKKNRRADAGLAAFAKATGFEAITAERGLTNF